MRIPLDHYIGIPFVDRGRTMYGADCYGLLELIYKENLNISIPEFSSSCRDAKRIFSDYLKQISEYWVVVTEEPKEYDVIAMAYDPSHPRIVQHFGLYIGNGTMIHTLQGIGAFTTKLEDFQPYIKGIYRWKASILSQQLQNL